MHQSNFSINIIEINLNGRAFMTRKILHWRQFFIPLFFSVIFTSTGTPSARAQAPDLPPLFSFSLDLTSFPSLDSLEVSDTNNVDRSHYLFAFNKIQAWNEDVHSQLVVPLAALKSAFSEQPISKGNNSWEWSYYFVEGSIRYDVTLQAKYTEHGFQWDLYISPTTTTAYFRWATGWAKSDMSVGWWQVSKSPEEPAPFIDVEWHQDFDLGTYDSRFTVVTPEGAANGNFLFIGLDFEEPNFAFIKLYSVEDNTLREVLWNPDTYEGFVKDKKFFGDNNPRCWDGNLNNNECEK